MSHPRTKTFSGYGRQAIKKPGETSGKHVPPRAKLPPIPKGAPVLKKTGLKVPEQRSERNWSKPPIPDEVLAAMQEVDYNKRRNLAPSITSSQKRKKSPGGRKGLPPTPKSSSTLSKGFVAQQQMEGKLPNASQFFEYIATLILAEGSQVSPLIMENIERHLKQDTVKKNSHLLLEDKEKSFLKGITRQINAFLIEQKNLKKILLLQTAIRWWRVRKTFQALRRNKEERERVLQRNEKFLELLKTEKYFVSSAEELINSYVIPLRHSEIIEPQEGAYLFSNIETIASEHRKLVERLQNLQCNWPFLGNVGEVFLDIKSLLNAMSVYVGHFKTAINEISRISAEKPEFEQFINQAAMMTEFDLASLLLVPVNRISQYEFYLRSLADTMLIGTKEREDCENAYSALNQSSIVVRRSLVESGNVANILKVQRKLRTERGPLSINQQGRIFRKEFYFKKNYVCLFNDTILIAKKDTALKKGKECHKFKILVPYQKTELILDSKNFELKILEGKAPVSFKFLPLNPDEKEEFKKFYDSSLEDANRIRVFNVPLIDTIIREERSSGIPVLIEILATFIKENLCKQAGIFRVAGASSEINELKEAFDAGETDPSVLRLEDKTPFSVCDTLKLYFRSFPEPMLGYALYEPIIAIMKNTAMPDEERVKQIQEALLHWTPPFAVKVLRYLMGFLNEISKFSEENKMTSNNIAIVFGPTLLWPENNTLEAAMDMPYVNGAIKVIIENFTEIL